MLINKYFFSQLSQSLSICPCINLGCSESFASLLLTHIVVTSATRLYAYFLQWYTWCVCTKFDEEQFIILCCTNEKPSVLPAYACIDFFDSEEMYEILYRL